MPARETAYAESLAAQNRTATSYADAVSLTHTPSAGTVMYIWSCNLQNNTNLTADAKVRFNRDTDAVVCQEFNVEMKDLLDQHPCFGITLVSYAGGASKTVSIEWAAETSGNSIDIEQARIVAIALDASTDFWTVEDGEETTTAGPEASAATKVTLTFTPPSQDDYFIFAAASHRSVSGAGDQMGIKLSDGTTNYGSLTSWLYKDATNIVGWGTICRPNLTASSKSFSIMYWNAPNAGDTMACKLSTIVAIPAASLLASYYNESRTRATGATSYTTKGTLTQTLTSGIEHLVFACGVIDSAATTTSTSIKLDDGGTARNECRKESQEVAQRTPWLVALRQDGTGSSKTWNVQYTRSQASGTSGLAEAAVGIIQTESSITTHFGACATAVVVSEVTAGKRTTFGVVVRSEVAAPDVAGRPRKFSSATVAETVTSTTAAKRTATGFVAVPIVVSKDAAGTRYTKAAAATPLVVSEVIAGTRSTRSSTSLPLVVGIATAGARQLLGATSLPIVVSTSAAGLRTARASSVVSIVVSKEATGTRSTFAAVARSEVAAIAVAGVRSTFGVVARSEVVSAATTGELTAFAASTTAEVVTITTDGTVTGGGGTTYFGATSLTLVVATDSAGVRSTFGAVSRSEVAAGATVGTRSTFGAVSRSETVGVVVAGRTTRLGSSSLALVVSRVTVGRLGARGVSSTALVVSRVTAGTAVLRGTVSVVETVAIVVSGTGGRPPGRLEGTTTAAGGESGSTTGTLEGSFTTTGMDV